ncbi:MAG: ATP-binding protein [Bacillota bacterium]|jgi:PAS domain S-box-containing protein
MPKARILIVEDEGIEALDIQHRLTNLGYSAPDIAFSGEEALRLVEQVCPDLVLMDIMLHGDVDGVTAAQEVQSRFGIPVVYLTAYADQDTVQRAKVTAPYGYLVKPFKERELDIAIDMALYKHRMERQLQESREWFATTLRSIGDGVIATDQAGQITFMNAVAEQLTGWQLSEVKGRRLTEVMLLINRDTRLPIENPASKVLRERRVVGLANHTLLIAKDGTEVPIDDSAAPIKDEQGRIIGVILVFRDVTERERAEEELRAAHDELERRVAERTMELEEANRRLRLEIEQRKLAEGHLQQKTHELENANLAKDRFLANMSHELRTPLNAIIGFTGVLQMKLPGPLTAEQEEQLGYISTSARQLLLLINDLLDLAKIESGKVSIYPEPISCSSVLQEVAGTLRPLADNKGLPLIIQPPEPDLTLHTDRRALMQVLLNLMHNAIKFTEQGEIRVLVKTADVDGQQQALFCVCDTGIGIKPEAQNRLFEAFDQASATGPYHSDGSGLGLYLCKRLSDLLGGEISYTSEYGRGSEFRLHLPLCSKEAQS